MIFSFVICSSSIAPIRIAPNHSSEMSSQMLFGERATVLCRENEWYFIETQWDQFEGWVHGGSFKEISFANYKKETKTIVGPDPCFLLSKEMYKRQLPTGSELFQLKSSTLPWLVDTTTTTKGKKFKWSLLLPNQKWVEQCALSYYGAPYVWGGRNNLGIDCSGFSQIVYKLSGIKLPRNASKQAKMGHEVAFLQEAQCGDLAFFDDDEGNINHVGILLNEHKIIHASQKSGAVVIDSIDQGGIISTSLKKRTAKLRIVKRLF